MSPNIGDRIGDFEITGILGAGGMGRVYKVRNVISDRVEAIKIVLPELNSVPELADRFVREIKVLAALDHPNIAALRTAQRIDDQLVMVMELVEGESIEAKLTRGPIPVPVALDYISQVLAALSYAHARGVIHRDIKPANMLVTESGTVKLMDFGIAKAASDRKLTMTGMTMGSLYYMSPEQIQGAELDARSDLYSLGVSLYEIVTGARPFKGDSDFSIMSAHLKEQPVPPIQIDPRLPAALSEVILLSIAKDPARRFQSATAFASAIGSVRKRGPSAVEPAKPEPAASPSAAAPSAPAAGQLPTPARSSRRGLYMALGAAVAVSAIVLAVIGIPRWRSTRAEEPGETVRQETTVAPPPETTVPPPQMVEQAPAQSGTGTSAVSQPAAPEPSRAPQARKRETPPYAQTAVQAPPRQPAKAASEPPSEPAPSPAASQSLPPAQPAAPAAQPPQSDPAVEAALTEIRKSWPMLASRAGAVSSGLRDLVRQQQASGLGLRGDITASWKRMRYFMNQLDSSLASKDAEAAKQNMEGAERELQILEKFLGL
ncbi:MAG: serine/threonine protein kinase [Bryobacterales bacterium]|nr:serine/threonine protein kinase [Bryobacterales bacterium]